MVDILTEKNREAEEILRQGLALLENDRMAEAHRLFERAYELDKENPVIASYYGLTCALQYDFVSKGLELCRRAADKGIPDPVLWLNLAKIYMRKGDRRNAVAALQRGLRIEKGNPAIIAYWKKIGMRRRPAIKFLSRDNIMNRILGKFTYNREGRGKGKGRKSGGKSAKRR